MAARPLSQRGEHIRLELNRPRNHQQAAIGHRAQPNTLLNSSRWRRSRDQTVANQPPLGPAEVSKQWHWPLITSQLLHVLGLMVRAGARALRVHVAHDGADGLNASLVPLSGHRVPLLVAVSARAIDVGREISRMTA
jgi:hypothetical protein